MNGRRHTPAQVVRKLREADRLLGEGFQVADVLKELQMSETTYHRWRAQYGGMKADGVKRLKELEAENAKLKRIVADQLLTSRGSRSCRGELLSPARRRRAVLALRDRLGMSERRACPLAGQRRSTQRHEPVVAKDDAALRAELRRISRERPGSVDTVGSPIENLPAVESARGLQRGAHPVVVVL